MAVRGSLALSTYNLDVSRTLCRWLPALLNDDRARVALLIGHRSSRYAADLAREHPALSDRVRVAEALDPEQGAAHASVCDLMIQPYPGGISSRRTTVMSALALGLPILTNAGRSTEPLWAESGAVIVVGGDDTTAVSAAGNCILRDPELRATRKSRASALYRERFAVERTVDRPRNDATEVRLK